MIYDFDALRRDVNDVAALLHTFHSEVNSLALSILDRINRAQTLHEWRGDILPVAALIDGVNQDMVELRARVNSAND